VECLHIMSDTLHTSVRGLIFAAQRGEGLLLDKWKGNVQPSRQQRLIDRLLRRQIDVRRTVVAVNAIHAMFRRLSNLFGTPVGNWNMIIVFVWSLYPVE